MCNAINEIREESETKGRDNVARNLLKDGALSVEKIAEMSVLPLSKIKELEKEIFPLK